MINITLSLAFLVPWLSISALWWIWVLGKAQLAQVIGGTVLFLTMSMLSLILIEMFLKSIDLKK